MLEFGVAFEILVGRGNAQNRADTSQVHILLFFYVISDVHFSVVSDL